MTRTMICGALAALTLGTMGPARSQVEVAQPRATAHTVLEGITACGHGEVKLKPDIAFLTVGVTTQASTSAVAAQDNANKTAALITAIKSLKIADGDIQTQNYNVNPQYDNDGHVTSKTGYEGVNSVRVTLRDLSLTGPLLDKATQSRANRIDGLTYDLSNRQMAQRQALALAVSDARSRAQVMAEAAGIGLGGLLSLTDGNQLSLPRASEVRSGASFAAAAPTPISSQEIAVTADVTLVYGMGAAK